MARTRRIWPARYGTRYGFAVARYDDDLRFAHVLADNADDITTRRFRALDLRVDTKPDLTPVSDADHAAEDSLRNVLRRSRPRDAVLGEETGRTGSGPRCWVIDPIDGTKNYVRGVPVWATLIGLMDGPEVVVGVVSAPALSRRWWAALGGGAWTGRSLTKASPLRVSAVTKLGDASMSYSSLGGWTERGLLDNFLGGIGRGKHFLRFAHYRINIGRGLSGRAHKQWRQLVRFVTRKKAGQARLSRCFRAGSLRKSPPKLAGRRFGTPASAAPSVGMD